MAGRLEPEPAKSAWRDPQATRLPTAPLVGTAVESDHDIHSFGAGNDIIPSDNLDDEGILTEKLSLAVRISYGAPSFATQPISLLIAVYAADYYVLLGTRLSLLSFFTAWARSFDVITDPLMAWVSDQTNLRFGRRRPFILAGAPFYAVFLVLFFSPPEALSEVAVGVWFCIFYTLFYLSDTVANVPYEALAPELSSGKSNGNSLFFTMKTFTLAGMLLAALGPAWAKFAARGQWGSPTQIPCGAYSSSKLLEDLIELDLGLQLPREGAPEGSCTAADECVPFTKGSCHQPLDPLPPLDSPAGLLGGILFVGWQKSYVVETLSGDLLQACGANLTLHNAPPCGIELWEELCSTADVSCAPATRYNMDAEDSQRRAFTIVALFFGIFYVISAISCVAVVKEGAGGRKKRKAPLVGAMIRTFLNPAFRSLLIAWTLEGIGLSALVSMFPFYVRYVLVSDGLKAIEIGYPQDPQLLMGLSLAFLLASAVLFSPFWLLLANRLGKYRSWLLYNFLNVATNTLFLVPREGQTRLLLVMAALNGIPLGGQFLVNSVLSDIIDYDEFLYGVRNEGIFSVYATLIPKFVAIPATAIPLAIVNMLGFVEPVNGSTQPQNTAVVTYIRVTFVVFPLLCYAVGFGIKALLFPIRKKEIHDEIRRGIAAQKKSGAAFKDPITGALIRPLHLTGEGEELAYQLENFGPALLTKVLDTEDTEVVVKAMQRHICTASAASFGTLGLTTATAIPLLKEPALSVLPTILVICFGAALCYLAISILRYRAATSLRAYPQDVCMDLARRMRDHKASRSTASRVELQS